MPPEKTLISLKIDKNLVDKVKKKARDENRSMTNFIETILLKYTNGDLTEIN